MSGQLASHLRERAPERGPDVLRGKGREWRQRHGLLELELPVVDAAREVRDSADRGRLLDHEGAAGVVAVTRHDDTGHQLGQGIGRGRPVERPGIVEERHIAALDQVAPKHDVGIGDRHDCVVIGVASTKEVQVHGATTDLDRRARVEDLVRWVDHYLAEVGRQRGFVACDPRSPGLAGERHERWAAGLPPDRRRPEDVVPECMVKVAMRVHDDRHRVGGEHPEVGNDLASLDMGRSGVDQQDRSVAQDGADVLVVELVAADEHAIADFDPGGHRAMVPRSPGAYAPVVPSIISRVTIADGTELLVRQWPAGGQADGPAAFVLLVHGLGEHSGRYEHVGEQLAGAGFDVAAYDQRGNGGSSGRRGHVDRWSQLHDDLQERLHAVRDAAEGRPIVLYGHSMGGLVVLGYLLTDRAGPDLVVLTAPGLDSTLPGWKQAAAKVLGRIAPTMPIPNSIDGSTLSRDPGVAEKVANDPACAHASTARFGAEGLAEQVRVRRDYGRLTLPTLVLHGLDDGLVPAAASEVLATLPNVERRTYPGLRHELHNEPEGPAILDEVMAWLRARIEGQPNTASGERPAR